MLSEQIRAIGALAHVLVINVVRTVEEPADLEAIAASFVATVDEEAAKGLVRQPINPGTIQAAVRLAEQMLDTLAKANAEREAAGTQDEWSSGNMMDDTGPAVEPKRRSTRFNRGRIRRRQMQLHLPGEDGDVVRVGSVLFESGTTYIGVMANANRGGHRPECYLGPNAARELADALRARADALDPPAKPCAPSPRKATTRHPESACSALANVRRMP